MVLSERSPQRAELLLMRRERRDESEKGASKGMREAVCLSGRGMLEGQGPYNGPKVQ